MRQALAIAAAAAVGLIVAIPPAGGAAAKGPTLRSLQAQITTLQRQVKALKKRVAATENVAYAAVALTACSTAVTADTFQDTWVGLNGYFVAHSLPAYFGAQTPVNDYSLCQPFSITRVHNQSPPTTAVLQALLDVFKPTSAAAEQGRVNLPGQTRYVFSQLFVLLR